LDSPPPPEPGTVWWCDGHYLAFEAHFKRRPVLILAAQEDGTLLVAPLSSKRRHGQEQAVTHAGGLSFLTGDVRSVPPTALQKPLGSWEGFAAWHAEQEAASRAAERWRSFIGCLRQWWL
jgi:mRNA-degrading endonuclease toxin of MazEF toxin-antitoxin module